MKAESILDTIGNTPHIRLRRLFGDRVEVWMKAERARRPSLTSGVFPMRSSTDSAIAGAGGSSSRMASRYWCAAEAVAWPRWRWWGGPLGACGPVVGRAESIGPRPAHHRCHTPSLPSTSCLLVLRPLLTGHRP